MTWIWRLPAAYISQLGSHQFIVHPVGSCHLVEAAWCFLADTVLICWIVKIAGSTCIVNVRTLLLQSIQWTQMLQDGYEYIPQHSRNHHDRFCTYECCRISIELNSIKCLVHLFSYWGWEDVQADICSWMGPLLDGGYNAITNVKPTVVIGHPTTDYQGRKPYNVEIASLLEERRLSSSVYSLQGTPWPSICMVIVRVNIQSFQ